MTTRIEFGNVIPSYRLKILLLKSTVLKLVIASTFLLDIRTKRGILIFCSCNGTEVSVMQLHVNNQQQLVVNCCFKY